MLGFLNWDLDPILIHLGPLQIRYYGVLFALTIYTGFYVWRRQALKNGESVDFAENFLWWGVIAVVGGSRLGHVFFYEYKTYLANPIEIIKFWKGGLASHGATVGLILAIWLYARRTKRTWARLGDYLAPAIAIAAGGVRIGNFFNSEIVGRVSDVPWAVQFSHYCRIERLCPPHGLCTLQQCMPRHPSQLYEFLMGAATYLVLMWVERRQIRRAGSGLYAGILLTMYFGLRIFVENFKEYQEEQLRSDGFLSSIDGVLGHPTTGQYLSVPLVIFGLFLIVRALRQDRDAILEPVPTADPERAPARA